MGHTLGGIRQRYPAVKSLIPVTVATGSVLVVEMAKNAPKSISVACSFALQKPISEITALRQINGWFSKRSPSGGRCQSKAGKWMRGDGSLLTCRRGVLKTVELRLRDDRRQIAVTVARVRPALRAKRAAVEADPAVEADLGERRRVLHVRPVATQPEVETDEQVRARERDELGDAVDGLLEGA